MSNRLIYEPKGAALEYAPLGLNIFTGCLHGCRYCYNAKSRFAFSKNYFRAPRMKADVLSRLSHETWKMSMQKDDREIFLSFLGDIYQPEEVGSSSRSMVVREVIQGLVERGLRFTVLTKGGMRAVMDFDLLQRAGDKASFGTSMVFFNEEDAADWEPGASNLKGRVEAIRWAKKFGIKTWVSIEPVIYPDQAIQIIREYHDIVDHWKVGKISHDPLLENEVNWGQARDDIIQELIKHGADFYIKKSLR